MDIRRVAAACALCLLICCLIALFVDEVSAGAAPGKPGAAGRPSAPGKPVPTKAAPEDQKRGPSTFQKTLGIGSVVVMIIVVKYL